MKRMAGLMLLLALMALLLTGCNEKNVKIFKYDGTVIEGQLVSGDFESEELVVRLADRGEIMIRFNEIKRIEMPKSSQP